MDKEKLRPKLNKWADILEGFIETTKMDNIFKTLKATKGKILPESKDLFHIFRQIPKDKVRLLMLVDDFNWSTLLKSISLEYNLDYNIYYRTNDFNFLYEQGIFLLPISLTHEVEKGPISHRDLWKDFIVHFLSKLDSKIPTLLIGEAKEFEEYSLSRKIWKLDSIKDTKGVFQQINLYLRDEFKLSINYSYKRYQELKDDYQLLDDNYVIF